MRGVIVGAFTVGFLAVLAAFTVMTLAGKDTTPLVLFASGAASSLVPNLLSLLKQHQVAADVAEVKERTNGPLTVMQEQVQAIAAHVVDGDVANTTMQHQVNEMYEGGK